MTQRGEFQMIFDRRSPQAYRAMIAVAVCYLAAGAVLGGLIIHLVTPAGRSGIEEAVVPGTGAGEFSSVNMPNKVSGRVVSVTDCERAIGLIDPGWGAMKRNGMGFL